MSGKKKPNQQDIVKSSEMMKVETLAQSVEDMSLDGEEIIVSNGSNAEDAKFDEVIGHIEDIIMEPKFQNLQNKYMETNYKHFEDTEENKFIYTNLHQEYINVIEKYIEDGLKNRIKNFSMQEFMQDLLARREEIDGEIFEILMTFEDFLEFKQLMLSYRASKEGRSIDLSSGLSIQSVNFESFRSSYAGGVQSADLCISGISATSTAKPQATLTVTNNLNNNNNNTNNNKNSSKANSSTPLLDNAQIIDSDHETSETTGQNRMSVDQK